MSVGELRFLVHSSCQTKVTYFHVAVRIQEYVSRLKISVKDLGALALAFTSMTVIEPLGYLGQDLPYHVFGDVLLLLATSSDYLC